MPRRAGVLRVLAAALIAAACSDAGGPLQPGSPGTPLLDAVSSGTPNGGLGQSGPALLARFVRNPRRGDAVIATFFWRGSVNIIDSVTDFVTDASSTRAGNTYQLVEYVTAGGNSMATYVATNVQNFPDTATNPGSGKRRRGAGLGVERYPDRCKPGDRCAQLSVGLGQHHDRRGSGRYRHRCRRARLWRVNDHAERTRRTGGSSRVYEPGGAVGHGDRGRGGLHGAGQRWFGRPAVDLEFHAAEHVARHGDRPQPVDDGSARTHDGDREYLWHRSGSGRLHGDGGPDHEPAARDQRRQRHVYGARGRQPHRQPLGCRPQLYGEWRQHADGHGTLRRYGDSVLHGDVHRGDAGGERRHARCSYRHRRSARQHPD